MLDGTGHDVVVAPDGKAGLGLIDEQPPDVVFTDILMPETDGLELIYTLRLPGRQDYRDLGVWGNGISELSLRSRGVRC